ncbi:MAG: hypothetical protein OHK0024_30080 [Thalassobaculales bacterium]
MHGDVIPILDARRALGRRAGQVPGGAAEPAAGPGFAALWRRSAGLPLTEVVPAAPGDAAAAAGFSLALLARGQAEGGLAVWSLPDFSFGEEGAPDAEGLAQFGLDLDRLLLVRGPRQADALWAAEEALSLPGAAVLASIMPSRQGLDLTATRRLLLRAERQGTRCLLLRLDMAGCGPMSNSPMGNSAAGMRWRVAAASSDTAGRGADGGGGARELGPPTFAVHLDRNRSGPAGLSWRLRWNAHARDFHLLDDAAGAGLDGDLAAAAGNRSA